MKQQSNKQKLHATIGILGKITILTGALLLFDTLLGTLLSVDLWPFRIIVPGVALFFYRLVHGRKTAWCGQSLVASRR